MQVQYQYARRSRLTRTTGGQVLSMAPNLVRDQVAFDAALREPLTFREAISTLHDIVINDLRFKPPDRAAYRNYLARNRQREVAIRKAASDAHAADVAIRGEPHTELKRDHAAALKRYWRARRVMHDRLRRENLTLWERLMLYDPVCTIADDVVMFECFSVDQSAYGCLSVDRESGFDESGGMISGSTSQLGTTNVDYSWDLYDSFQSLRSYRETRFQIDPTAVAVSTTHSEQEDGTGDDQNTQMHREEKIDLPDGWLKGFMQLQAAMTLPTRVVRLSVSSVYSILAFLRRHKARTSPRAIRFEVGAKGFPRIVLEPWEQVIDESEFKLDSAGGDLSEPIRIWGRRRLLTLARVLPIAQRIDVHLLATGLPSFWVVHGRGFRLTLGLSGWTANDWSAGTAVDMLMPTTPADARGVAKAAETLSQKRAMTRGEIATSIGTDQASTLAAMNELALRGQVIHDLDAGIFRWRQIMPMEVSDREIGGPHPERVGCEELIAKRQVDLQSRQDGPRGGLILTGKVGNQDCEVLIDGDGRIVRGKCRCSWHFKYGIRNGPCRHLQALRETAWHPPTGHSNDWWARLRAMGLHVQ
ncbi:MAG: metal-binding protein [Planctomycetota bacterium]